MAKIVKPIILQLQNLSSCKDILNELKQEVENLNRSRESIIHEVEAGKRHGEVIEDEAGRWLNKVDQILGDADKLFKASRNAEAGCLPNLKSQNQLGRKARKLTADVRGLSAVKFDHAAKRHRDEIESRKRMKEIIMSLKERDEINKIGIYGLDGVGDQTTIVKTVIKTVEDDKLFDRVIMARVSKTSDVDRIQCEIADQLGFSLKEMTSERAGSLHEILKKEKSILIIFYDIDGKIDLEKLGIPLEDHHKGCKLLLISRNEHILQENEIEKKFSFRLEFRNGAELWSLCQTTPGAGVNEEKILELTNHSLEPIWNELEDKVLQIFLLCGVCGKSVFVSDLFKYIVGLGLFKHINSIDNARNELKKIIGVLKASFPTLVYVDDGEFQMNGLLRDIAKKVENAPFFTMERNVPLKDWPSEDSLRKCTQIILGGNRNIQKLPERLDCPNLELLHLDSTDNGTLKIPDSFFKGMTNLQALDLIGMVIQPELPASLVSLTKLKTLCFNACSLGSMSGIEALRNLEVLSFCHSSMTNFPYEIRFLAHLRMLDLLSASEIEVFMLQNILSNLTELEELCMENLYINDHDQLIASLKKLSAIKTKSCGQLKCLFLVSEIIKLSQLVDIEVSECGSMETIVLLDSGLTIDEIESIPVRSLTLQHLPELNGFCCNDSKVLDIPTLFPNKEDLFRPLKHLNVVGVSRIRLLVITALSNGMIPLQYLGTLEIEGCSGLQYLFVIKGRNMYENYGGLLPYLYQLRLRNLGELRSIVGLNHPRGTLSFKMLKDLIVCSCNQLRYVLPLYVLQNLRQLENIVINDCKMLEWVFGDEEQEDTQMTEWNGNYGGLLPHLCQLRLRNLGELRSIVGLNHPRGTLSFKMLKDLKVRGCKQLRYVLPLYVLQNLHQLENIAIIDCEVLEWVFGDEEEGTQMMESNGNTAAKQPVDLPRVNSLILEKLPKFTGCCQDGSRVKWPSFKEIRLVECPMIKKSSLGMIDRPLFTSMEVIKCNTWAQNEPLGSNIVYLFEFTDELSTLEDLTIKDSEELKKYMEIMKLQESFFIQLKTLEARQCNQELANFLSLLLGRSDKLKELKVENCQQLEHVFNLTEIEFVGEEHKNPKFPNLETMQLLCLPKLTCIWKKDPREIVELGKLVKLEIFKCGLLKSLFSTALVEKLVQLEKLKIESCEMIEQVVEGDDTETKGRPFPSLKDLQLGRLPKLTKFISGHCNLTFPNLQRLRIEECPEFNAFTIGLLSKTTNEGTSYHVPLDERMDTCPKLERLKLVGHKSLEEIWQGFQNLMVIRVKGCDALQHLLLPFKLTEIDISDCRSLQLVFIDTKIKEDENSFPDLKSIVLENLPMLSNFSLETFEFPKLEKARIVNCPAFRTFSRNVSARANNIMGPDSSESLPLGHRKTRFLPKLQVLELSDLAKMQLWNQEPQIAVLNKLVSLKIIGCGSIDKLFSISVAQYLSSLKFLTLYKCENMVQVLQGGGGNSNTVFQKLETLVLKHLPRLSSFCEDDVDFGEFPELRMVRVEDIPNMHTFVKKPLKTPKLKEVHVIFIRKCWQGDLNRTISYLQQNHEKLKVEAWESDQSSTRHDTDTAESSFQGKFEIEESSGR